MTTQVDLPDDDGPINDAPHLRQAIRDLMKEVGATTPRDLAILARDREVFSPTFMLAVTMNGLVSFVRRALKESDTGNGVPFAKPLDDKVWQQTSLFTFDEAQSSARRDAERIKCDVQKLEYFVRAFEARFGREMEDPVVRAMLSRLVMS